MYTPINTLSSPEVTIDGTSNVHEWFIEYIPVEEEAAEEEEEAVSALKEFQDPVPVVIISLCRDQYRENMKEKDLDHIIMNNRVSYSDVFENPSLLEHPNVDFFTLLDVGDVLLRPEANHIGRSRFAHRRYGKRGGSFERDCFTHKSGTIVSGTPK